MYLFKSKVLTTALLSLALIQSPSLASSLAGEFDTDQQGVYDENSLGEFESNEGALIEIGNPGDEPLLSATEADPSRAKLVAIINKSSIGSTSQKMKVYYEGKLIYEWLVSTGREKLEQSKSGRVYRTTTPIGYYRPTKIELNHYSQTWKADMPHAVFFNGGIAVHASTHVELLGKRASGGCVRLAPENAKTFYNLVKQVGIRSVPRINQNGMSLLDQNGSPMLTQSWDVLIIVENRI